MSKKKKQEKKVIEEKNFLEKLEKKYQYIIAIAVILIPLIFSFSPYLFEDLRPTGTDIVASKGQSNLYKQWESESGERALWNPNIFTGMPVYHRLIPNIIQFDTIINMINPTVYWVFMYFLVGALGMFFLLVYKKIPWQLALIVAVAFTFLPDWQALHGDGHYTKLRAIMILPWLILSFHYFFDKNNWFSAAAFALIFSWMFRTQHFQIVFYGILILFFLFIYPTIKLIIDKKYKEFLSLALKFAVAIVLTVITAAQPFLSLQEYAPYSTRGGNPVDIGTVHDSARESGGVDLAYATQWSLAPSEMLDFFIQRFHGGISGETYDGDKYDQFKGQQIPGYWGQKPFSGNYHYMGMILFLFAVLGVIKYRNDRFVIALGVFVVFSLMLSWGRHFLELYQLFYYYVPFFSKFRAPSMMANMTFIAILLLSGYGLKAIFALKHPIDTKLIVGILGSAVLFALVVLLFKESFSYLGPNETRQYNAETINLLKDIRKEFLTADTIRLLIMLILTSAATLAFYFKKIKGDVFTVFIFVLVLAELVPAYNRAFDKIELNHIETVEAAAFRQNNLTKFLSNKSHTDRLLAVGREFQSNHYSYFHPTINGYSAIKMQTIQDINEHVLFSQNTPDRVNWNVVNMLGGKYIISDGRLDYNFLSPVAAIEQEQKALYVNNNVLPKAWFVKSIKYFDAANQLVLFMNDTSFHPSTDALMLAQDKLENSNYTGEGEVDVLDYTPNSLRLYYKTNQPQFLVISEPFYPEGWHAELNGEQLKIHKVNHHIKGIEVPAGEGNIDFTFAPETYFSAVTYSWIGDIVILLIGAVFGFFMIQNRKKGEAAE